MSSLLDASSTMAQLMSSKKYSDLQLVCEGEEFPVHKAIVCTQSTVLAAACDGGFQEATAGKININEFKVETVQRMIDFLYKKDYRVTTDEPVPEETIQPLQEATELDMFELAQGDPVSAAKSFTTRNILAQHVQVNAIADYYNLPQLKQLSNVKIQHVIETLWSADGFSTIVQQVFDTTTDKSLHSIMASTTAKYIDELFDLDKFATPKLTSDFFSEVIQGVTLIQKAKDDAATCKLEELESRLEEANSRIDDLKSRLESETLSRQVQEEYCNAANARAASIIENANECHKVLENHRRCRNSSCDAEFKCYVERGGPMDQPTYLLRCARCYCRHKP